MSAIKRIMVINYTGNVGKSFLCRYLLAKRLNNPHIFKVESTNSDGTDDLKRTAHEFDEIFEDLISYRDGDVIVDVGSSNAELFYKKLSGEYEGSHEFFDSFIIPITPDSKQQIDSLSTYEALIGLGVEPEKIKIVLNDVGRDDRLEVKFQQLLERSKDYDLDINLKEIPIVHHTDLFVNLLKNGMSYEMLDNDDRDYNALLSNPELSPKEKTELEEAKFWKIPYKNFHRNLDKVFKQLKI